MQIAPDGKIYSCTVSGSNVLYVIHSPDEPGEACQYQQHGITLLTYNSKSIPNPFQQRLAVVLGASLRSPAFRLYDAIGRLARSQSRVFGIKEVETGICR